MDDKNRKQSQQELVLSSDGEFLKHIVSEICDYARDNGMDSVDDTLKTVANNILTLTDITTFENWKMENEIFTNRQLTGSGKWRQQHTWKCKKCGNTDFKVWESSIPCECFLECRKCGWMGKNRKWTKKLKRIWESQQA